VIALNRWLEKKHQQLAQLFLHEQTFSRHFEIEHQFHGLQSKRINESYTIRPKSNLGIQVFIDGIQTYDVSLHLRSDILIHPEEICVKIQVEDPKESQKVMKEVKKIILTHLKDYQGRFQTDPKVKYVQQFCDKCVHFETKPLNLCMRHCKFTPKND
jgi:hypothetical protein